MKNRAYQHLLKNISDMVFEGLIKIGYMEGQSIRIYYDHELLSELLQIKGGDRLDLHLKEFVAFAKSSMGEVQITNISGRYEFLISDRGVKYIYENNERRYFLKELIETLGKPVCTMEEVLAVFQKESENLEVREIQEGEFQYVVAFQDRSIDEFNYCFTFDEMGHYYHRLLDYDFNRLME